VSVPVAWEEGPASRPAGVSSPAGGRPPAVLPGALAGPQPRSRGSLLLIGGTLLALAVFLIVGLGAVLIGTTAPPTATPAPTANLPATIELLMGQEATKQAAQLQATLTALPQGGGDGAGQATARAQATVSADRVPAILATAAALAAEQTAGVARSPGPNTQATLAAQGAAEATAIAAAAQAATATAAAGQVSPLAGWAPHHVRFFAAATPGCAARPQQTFKYPQPVYVQAALDDIPAGTTVSVAWKGVDVEYQYTETQTTTIAAQPACVAQFSLDTHHTEFGPGRYQATLQIQGTRFPPVVFVLAP